MHSITVLWDSPSNRFAVLSRAACLHMRTGERTKKKVHTKSNLQTHCADRRTSPHGSDTSIESLIFKYHSECVIYSGYESDTTSAVLPCAKFNYLQTKCSVCRVKLSSAKEYQLICMEFVRSFVASILSL